MITQPLSHKRKALSALLTLLLLWLPTAAQQPVPAPATTPKYVLTPTDIPAGKTSVLILKLSDDSTLLHDPIKHIDVQPAGGELTIKSQTLSPDHKRLVILADVPAETAGPTALRVRTSASTPDALLDTDAVSINVTEFKQKPLDPKPTPNGIRRVDAMWTLLPDRVIKDNYGSKTAESYYGIQVVLGNNSGFDMQVVGMGFVTRLWPGGGGAADGHHFAVAGTPNYFDERCLIEPEATPSPKPGETAQAQPTPTPDKDHAPSFARGCVQIPAIDHRLVRGTIEKEQAFGKRAKMLGFLTAAGTVTTGFTPFFRAANPKANFSSFTSVLNGQFKEGFNLAVPDLTVRQLNRLETQVMHDSLTIPNNGQERTVIFVPKGIFARLDETGKKLMKEILPPAEVTRRLGELILVGRPLIYFEDRQIVVARTERPAPTEATVPSPAPTQTPASSPPTPTVTSITPNTGAQDETHEVIISGTGFTPGARPVVKFGTASATGEVLNATTIKVTPPVSATAGQVTVFVDLSPTPPAPLNNGYTYLAKLELTTIEPQTAVAGTTVVLHGHGFMPNTQVLIGGVAAPIISCTPDLLTVMLPAHAPGVASVLLINPNGKTAPLKDAFTYQ